MITYHYTQSDKIVTLGAGQMPDISHLVWVDMNCPDKVEEAEVENLLGIDVPTREEMHEIEASSRFYSEGDALFMTSTLVTQAASENPERHSVTFILKDTVLVTLRYSDHDAFLMLETKLQRGQVLSMQKSFDVFANLMESVIDSISDRFEIIGYELDITSKAVFTRNANEKNGAAKLQEVLKKIGRLGDLNSKFRESLLSLARIASFLHANGNPFKTQYSEQIDTLVKDVHSLSEHAIHIASRTNLLLEATLGMINIEQNAIIKIFSVAAVVFLPPTLIASIYGMNFHAMPELNWPFGYPMAIGMMVLSAILPYLFFKRKGWL